MILDNGHQFAHAMEAHYLNTIASTDPKDNPLYLMYSGDSSAAKLSAAALGWMLRALGYEFETVDVNDKRAVAFVDIAAHQQPVFISFLRNVTDTTIRLLAKCGDPQRSFIVTDSCTFVKDKGSNEPILDTLSKMGVVVQGAYMPLTTVTGFITPLPPLRELEDQSNEMVIAQHLYNYAHNPNMSPIYKRRFVALPLIIESTSMKVMMEDVDVPSRSHAFQVWHDKHHEELIHRGPTQQGKETQ